MTKQDKAVRERNLTVKVSHARRVKQSSGLFTRTEARNFGLEILPTGGLTVAEVRDENGRIVYATAHCSNKDQFCKRLGRAIATGRALALLQQEGN